MLNRRQILSGALTLAAINARASDALVLDVQPGLLVRPGLMQDATATNDDAIANLAAIIGQDAVAVFDPGGSLHDGQTLRAAIRARTPLPIRYVILSHIHPDHIFGAGAFAPDHPHIVAHASFPAARAARGQFYQDGLNRILGPGRAGPVPMPTMLIHTETPIDLGNRTLIVAPHRPAHTGTDLTALDTKTHTLLAGDLLFVDRIPSLDGDLKGWLAELALLKTLPATHAVPGHGPALVPWPTAAAPLERYLTTLLTETRAAVTKGIPIDQAAHSVAQGERAKWQLFDDYNPRNVIEAYRQLEWE
jgi:quinoprotein relay system zinc metallohydrolase 2